MNNKLLARQRKAAAILGAALLFGGLEDGAVAQHYGGGAYRDDARTCRRFGAAEGKAYTRCMLEQQRRRDNAPLYAAEQQRNNAEAARNNVETVRRIRCNREAKRAAKRGERPEPCW